MQNYEDEIIENANFYKNNPLNQWGGKTDRFIQWYEFAYRHASERFIPHIQRNNEKLIAYWPIYLFWGSRSEYQRGVVSQETYLTKLGTFGTGYLGLTNINLYLFVFRNLTELFPFHLTGTRGFAARVLGMMTGVDDARGGAKEDKNWTIPFHSLIGAQIQGDEDGRDTIFLQTTSVRWQIYEHFSDSLPVILTGINMAIAGKLTNLAQSNPPNINQADTGWKCKQCGHFNTKVLVCAKCGTSKKGTTNPEIIELLKKLGELKNAGILTEDEFNRKKNDLLSRL